MSSEVKDRIGRQSNVNVGLFHFCVNGSAAPLPARRVGAVPDVDALRQQLVAGTLPDGTCLAQASVGGCRCCAGPAVDQCWELVVDWWRG
jgi:hypothetical protein